MKILKGCLKGRKLVAPKGILVRPTLTRVRESIFDFLGDITDFAILDLYAGIGSLGLEALSLGAKTAVFVEFHPKVRAFLEKNIQNLCLQNESHVFPGKVEEIRKKKEFFTNFAFDLVFVDPPYKEYDKPLFFQNLISSLKELIWEKNGVILFDHPQKVLFPKNWENIKKRKFGTKGWSAFWIDSLFEAI